MKTTILSLFVLLAAATSIASANAQNVTSKDVHFYSEGVLCYGKLFLPSGYSDTSKLPAVVFAPGARQTSGSLEAFASQTATKGIVALTFDYRGVGKSGGVLYFGEPVRSDDRLRFSQTTTKMLIRRGRIEPQMQLIDIRNAITFLQGEAGVERTRIGVWGTDLSGDHAVVVAATDARVKAVVAQSPKLEGRDLPRKAFNPTIEQQAMMIKLARGGTAPTTQQAAITRNAEESKLALAEYHAFWFVDQIPSSTAVLLVLTSNDTTTEANANAAKTILKGAADLVKASDAGAASSATALWFARNL